MSSRFSTERHKNAENRKGIGAQSKGEEKKIAGTNYKFRYSQKKSDSFISQSTITRE